MIIYALLAAFEVFWAVYATATGEPAWALAIVYGCLTFTVTTAAVGIITRGRDR